MKDPDPDRQKLTADLMGEGEKNLKEETRKKDG